MIAQVLRAVNVGKDSQAPALSCSLLDYCTGSDDVTALSKIPFSVTCETTPLGLYV